MNDSLKPRVRIPLRTRVRGELPSLLIILVISSIVAWLHSAGLLEGFESLALDTLQIVGPEPNLESHLRIVSIGDDYFVNQLHGSYPLDPAGVAKVVTTVAQGSPSLIAVDLDTSRWSPEDYKLVPNNIPIVWARDIMRSRGAFCALPVLDNKGLLDRYTGIAGEPADRDGVVRRYDRVINIEMCNSMGQARPEPVQTFPWAVASYVLKIPPEEVRNPVQNELVLNFFGDRFDTKPIPIEIVMQLADKPDSDFSTRGPLTGKIALIGGYYHAAHDIHTTPRGPMPGVEITAQAIESELNARGLHAINEIRMTAVEIGFGLVLIAIHRISGVRTGLLLSLLAFLIIGPIGSYIAYSSYALWANFIPVLIAVLMHEFYDQARSHEKSQLREARILEESGNEPAIHEPVH